MRADYYFFAPTGGRYQTVFRGTLPRRTASGVRNVVITRRDRTPFHYLCGYADPTYFIVRGNCEALCVRNGTITR